MIHKHRNETTWWTKELSQHCAQQRFWIQMQFLVAKLDIQRFQKWHQILRILAEHVRINFVNRLQDELDECARYVSRCSLVTCKSTTLLVEVPVTPQPRRKLASV